MSFARCLLFLACLSAVQATVAPFDPLKYQKTTARCRATRRGDVDEVVDIQLSEAIVPFYFPRAVCNLRQSHRVCGRQSPGAEHHIDGPWLAESLEYLVVSDPRV